MKHCRKTGGKKDGKLAENRLKSTKELEENPPENDEIRLENRWKKDFKPQENWRKTGGKLAKNWRKPGRKLAEKRWKKAEKRLIRLVQSSVFYEINKSTHFLYKIGGEFFLPS